jgi:omega-6 fatty acid desaturase (delta-12 desaturase)
MNVHRPAETAIASRTANSPLDRNWEADIAASQVNWNSRLASYKSADNKRATFELALTSSLFLFAWLLTWAVLQYSVILALVIAIPTGGMMVRMFAIQHDCGHGAMFSSKHANDWVGRLIGVLTLTPYEYWRHSHALHHASSGNLDKRGFGDIETLTVNEYLALSRWGRLKYRLYRNPAVMFGIGPAYLFFFKQRLPIELMDKGAKPWISTIGTNLAIAAVFSGLIYLMGWRDFLVVQVSIILIGASAGIWLFYVQHQFEDTLWERAQNWKRENAALRGSSYYDLPKPLMWITGNIGVHHVHHLSSSIPFHRLPQILRDYPELKDIGRLTIWESVRCIPLALWDEKSRELISFRELNRRLKAGE